MSSYNSKSQQMKLIAILKHSSLCNYRSIHAAFLHSDNECENNKHGRGIPVFTQVQMH